MAVRTPSRLLLGPDAPGAAAEWWTGGPARTWDGRESVETPMHIGGVATSERPPASHAELTARFEAKLPLSAVFADPPVGLDDPVDRLAAIREDMEGLKKSKGAVAGARLTELSGFAPPVLLAAGQRLAATDGHARTAKERA